MKNDDNDDDNDDNDDNNDDDDDGKEDIWFRDCRIINYDWDEMEKNKTNPIGKFSRVMKKHFAESCCLITWDIKDQAFAQVRKLSYLRSRCKGNSGGIGVE